MKRRFATLVAVAVLGTACCLGQAARAGQVVEIHGGVTTAESSVYTQVLYRWAEYLAEEGDGSLIMKVFPNSQLGSQTEIIEQMQAGALVIGVSATTLLADYGAPELSIIGGPYLFESWEDADKLVDSDWYAEQTALLEKNGIKMLCPKMHAGGRHTLSRMKLEKQADFVGKKIRVPSSNSNVKAYEALGSAAIPMNLGEVYTALQTGIVDGEDNGLATMVSEKHEEVAKYLLLDNHVFDLQSLMTSAEAFSNLSPEHQDLLMRTGQRAQQWFNENAVIAAREAVETMKAAGVTITEVTDFSDFKKAAAAYYSDPQMSGSWRPCLYERVRKILAE